MWKPLKQADPAVDVGKEASLPLGICASWAMGSAGIAVMANIFGTLLLRYMTDYLGIAAGIAGSLIAVSKLYDALTDPVIGAVSDRWQSRIGRRRPFLLLGMVLCPLSMVAMFFPPDFSNSIHTEIYMLIVLLVFGTAYSIWQVPYLAMAAEMTENYKERSRLFGFRLFGGTLGQLLTAIFGPWLLIDLGGGRAGYAPMGGALGGVIFVSCLICFAGTRRARFHVRSPDKAVYSIGRQLRLVMNNKPLLILLSIESLGFLGIAASASLLPYLIKYVLQVSDSWIGTFILLNTAGLMASIPGWLWVGRRLEKKYVAMLGSAIYGAGCLAWLVAAPGTSSIILVCLILLQGCGTAASVMFRQSMFVDTIEYDYRRSGIRREGVFTGLFSLCDKSFSAFGLLLVGALLGASGYMASVNNGIATQPAAAITATKIMFAMVPAFTSLATVILLTRYDLTEGKLKATIIRSK
jgi:GPH family glycoside/pentoside/hexuronide:cation symporter